MFAFLNAAGRFDQLEKVLLVDQNYDGRREKFERCKALFVVVRKRILDEKEEINGVFLPLLVYCNAFVDSCLEHLKSNHYQLKQYYQCVEDSIFSIKIIEAHDVTLLHDAGHLNAVQELLEHESFRGSHKRELEVIRERFEGCKSLFAVVHDKLFRQEIVNHRVSQLLVFCHGLFECYWEALKSGPHDLSLAAVQGANLWYKAIEAVISKKPSTTSKTVRVMESCCWAKAAREKMLTRAMDCQLWTTRAGQVKAVSETLNKYKLIHEEASIELSEYKAFLRCIGRIMLQILVQLPVRRCCDIVHRKLLQPLVSLNFRCNANYDHQLVDTLTKTINALYLSLQDSTYQSEIIEKMAFLLEFSPFILSPTAKIIPARRQELMEALLLFQCDAAEEDELKAHDCAISALTSYREAIIGNESGTLLHAISYYYRAMKAFSQAAQVKKLGDADIADNRGDVAQAARNCAEFMKAIAKEISDGDIAICRSITRIEKNARDSKDTVVT